MKYDKYIQIHIQSIISKTFPMNNHILTFWKQNKIQLKSESKVSLPGSQIISIIIL